MEDFELSEIPYENENLKELDQVAFADFLKNYNNIIIKEKYDATMGPELVVATTPEQGNSVSIHSSVYLYVNSIKNVGEESSKPEGNPSSDASSTSSTTTSQ